MINFSQYLTEAAEEGKQKHLDHVTDHVFRGHEGVARTESGLRSLYNALIGRKRGTPERIDKKIDGAPAFHIGKDSDGRVFVATKSIFNKNPKINYTHEDIERNHGHAPGLVEALKGVLDHAHKILPHDMKPGEMYKGDLLFHGQGERGLQNAGEHVSAQPNLLNYMWPKDSSEGAKAAQSKLGFALHTYFDKNGNAQPISSKQRAKFIDHPDVFNYDPSAEINPANFNAENQRAFEEHMENARKSYSRINPEHYDDLNGHSQHLETFINHRVRNGLEGSGNVDEYLDFLGARAQKGIDSVKTAAAKERKAKEHASMVNQVVTNKKQLQHLLDMHGHFENAKNVLINTLNKNSTETIQYPDGSPGEHEGHVITHKDPTTGESVQDKIVERVKGGFAQRNLGGQGVIGSSRNQGQTNENFSLVDRLIESFNESLGATTSNKHRAVHHSFRRSVHIEPRVGEKQIPIRTSVAAARNQHQQFAARSRNKVAVREETEDNTKRVLSYVRMNPIHEGHRTVVNAGVDEAKRQGAEFKLILSHSHDAKKNPLSPEQKLKHARRAFPGVNISVSTPEHPTLLHHISKAYSEGVRHLTIVGGSDRDAFAGLAEKYKGVKGKHGYYGKDMNIKFVQAGEERDESSGGVSSFSAKKMREAVRNNDRELFHKMAPKTMSPKHIDEMMQDVQAGMRG